MYPENAPEEEIVEGGPPQEYDWAPYEEEAQKTYEDRKAMVWDVFIIWFSVTSILLLSGGIYYNAEGSAYGAYNLVALYALSFGFFLLAAICLFWRMTK